MTRNSPYFPLRWRVDFRARSIGGWETMAAFNVGSVALAYAAACRHANSSFAEYRVMQRDPRGQWQEMSA
jgi:hypothetical protein